MNTNPAHPTLSAAQVAARLSVKVETVYAYASRGLLARAPSSGKASRFVAADVERLAAKGRAPGTRRAQALVIPSALTELRAGAVFYRGKDAAELCRTHRFEQVAEWLWSGAGALDSSAPRFEADRKRLGLARALQRRLPAEMLPVDRLRVIASVLGSSDAMRYETSPGAVIATARALMAGMVEALPAQQPATAAHDSLAERLWTQLCPARATPAGLRLLDAAMILCADHALSPSTLAVRIAASQRADPYAVVQTGMGTLSGVVHGAACLAAEELIQQVESGQDPSAVIGIRLRRGERIPGFGHTRHLDGDPRATALLDLLDETLRPAAQAASRAVLAVMRERALPSPNIDFALAALARSQGMLRGASEAIMTVARTSGWIAHALEEYANPTTLPWDAAYIGPR